MKGMRWQILFDLLAKRLPEDVTRELMNSERPMIDHLEASGFSDVEISEHLLQLHRDYSTVPTTPTNPLKGRWL